jgi:uncharacterized cupredoxin-like copper-binding protein
MPAGRRRTGIAAAVALAASSAVLLAGCGGGGSTSSGGATPAGGATSESTASSPAGSSAATSVTATETEFSIGLSQESFTPGTYTFKVENTGSAPHNLVVKGPGVASVSSPTLEGGQSGEVTVELQKGSYELWCAVGNHRAQGMDLKISVA